MSALAYFILFAQACLILNASGALCAVIAPFGYEAGLATPCGGCGLATGIAGPCGLTSAFNGPLGLNAPFAGAYGCGAGLAGPYGFGAGFAGPFNAGLAGPLGAPLIV